MPSLQPTLQGELSSQAFAGVLAHLVAQRETGLLGCSFPPVQKVIYLKDGVPEFVSSNLAGELLGEYLVTRGVIRRNELDMALAAMTEFGGRLGDMLVTLGLLDLPDIVKLIGEQRKSRIVELFRWRKGHFEFFAGMDPPAETDLERLDPSQLLAEGMQSGYDDDEVMAILRQGDRIAPGPDAGTKLCDLDLPPSYHEVLASVKEPVRVFKLLLQYDRRGPRAGSEARRALVFGLQAGLLAWVREPG